MKKIYLSFLWHMHQPYYKDDVKGVITMPWVFLHAIKDYYDIPDIAAKMGIKAMFNLVPSLLKQLQEYEITLENDEVLQELKSDKIPKEKGLQLLNRFIFAANVQTMIQPLSQYTKLYKLFKKDNESVKSFTVQQLQDAKVLFLLSWCGKSLKEDDFIKVLLKQQKNYTQEQKEKLFTHLQNFIKKIIPLYKKLYEQYQIKLTTTPFYHPITPLLLNKTVAQTANKNTTLPKTDANLSQLASMHLDLGLQKFKECFGFKPTFIWPAEGGVCSQTLKLFQSRGVKAVATDEEILYKSLPLASLYDRYSYKGVDIYFRDKRLSDMIGFEFSQVDAKSAVLRFMSYLKQIPNDEAYVNVILDGENAWEYFPNNAVEFFYELYKALNESDFVEVIFFDEAKKAPIALEKLSSGSWISGNFDIWMGDSEKNRAWELIDNAFLTFTNKKKSLKLELQEKIYNEFLIASGSDWFWWYGDDHFTFYSDHFDKLFRTHLINIYTLMNETVPEVLHRPISKQSIGNLVKHPNAFVTIEQDNEYQWLECGEIDFTKELSTMHTDLIIQKALFGYDKKYFYMKFVCSKRVKADVALTLENKKYQYTSNQVVKIVLPNKNEINLKIEIKDNKNVQTFPNSGSFKLSLKDFSYDWFV